MCTVLHQHHHHHGEPGGGSLSSLEDEENDEKKWWHKFIPQQNKKKKDKSRKRKRKSSRNINVRAAFIHVIGDLIQSIGILIAGYIIKFFVSYTCQKVYLANCYFYCSLNCTS